MTIADLGSLGEFLGALAVLASVLYLAAQIRHGIRAAESGAVQNVTDQFARMQFDMARDGELADIIARAKSGGPLTEVERGRVGDMLSAYLIAFENLFVQHSNGLMSEQGYAPRRKVLAWLLASPFARNWWDSFGRLSHPEVFVREVDAILAEAEADAAAGRAPWYRDAAGEG